MVQQLAIEIYACRIMKAKFCILLLILLGLCHRADAQKVSVSTNFVDWAYFGTTNAEIGVSVAQHISLSAGARYNPWKFQTDRGNDMYSCQTTAYIGARYWPWYVFSGWWIGGKVQYSDFSETGMWRPALEQGRSMGAGVSGGYTLMLHEKINLEFSAGFWGGRHFEYNIYECPKCMVLRDNSPRNFFSLDDVSISLMFIF